MEFESHERYVQWVDAVSQNVSHTIAIGATLLVMYLTDAPVWVMVAFWMPFSLVTGSLFDYYVGPVIKRKPF